LLKEDIMTRRVFSIKVENRFGVLARVAGLFSARGYNIDSLAVSKTEHDDISIMTIVVNGDDRILEQVKKQLNKLIDVIKVSDHTPQTSVQRELALVKLNCPPAKRSEIIQLAEIFKAEIADIACKSITISINGNPETIERFIELSAPYGIKESMRTGLVSIQKDREK
jgi:acetolactate synthase-1/3 small subunit